jgi:hypothetical protein
MNNLMYVWWKIKSKFKAIFTPCECPDNFRHEPFKCKLGWTTQKIKGKWLCPLCIKL